MVGPRGTRPSWPEGHQHLHRECPHFIDEAAGAQGTEWIARSPPALVPSWLAFVSVFSVGCYQHSIPQWLIEPDRTVSRTLSSAQRLLSNERWKNKNKPQLQAESEGCTELEGEPSGCDGSELQENNLLLRDRNVGYL